MAAATITYAGTGHLQTGGTPTLTQTLDNAQRLYSFMIPYPFPAPRPNTLPSHNLGQPFKIRPTYPLKTSLF